MFAIHTSLYFTAKEKRQYSIHFYLTLPSITIEWSKPPYVFPFSLAVTIFLYNAICICFTIEKYHLYLGFLLQLTPATIIILFPYTRVIVLLCFVSCCHDQYSNLCAIVNAIQSCFNWQNQQIRG